MKITIRLIAMYLDYINNSLSIQQFAELHKIDIEEAEIIIDTAKKLNNL